MKVALNTINLPKIYYKKVLKIPKWPKKDNRTNNDLQNIAQKAKNRATSIPLITDM